MLSSSLHETRGRELNHQYLFSKTAFFRQMVPHASWPPVGHKTWQLTALKPGVLSQESSARSSSGKTIEPEVGRSPQRGVFRQESSVRSPQPGLLSQEASAKKPQPRVLSLQPGILNQESSARSAQPGVLHQESSTRSPQPGYFS